MPELPEVHTTKEGLKKRAQGLVIKDVWSDYFKKTANKRSDNVKNQEFFNKFKKETIGQKIKDVERKGKNILIHLSQNKTILIHMKMTGHLLFGKYKWNGKEWLPQDNGPLKDSFNKFIHFLIEFKNGKSLAFSDMRKFAKITLFETHLSDNHPDLKILGPDPLEKLTLDVLQKQLSKKLGKKIKTVLMDQTVLAGIGNIYSDEILWMSGIHPERKVSTLKKDDVRKMLKNMILILNKSISLGGDSMSDYRNIDGEKGSFQKSHQVYRRAKQKCLKKGCPGIIERKIVGGRSAHYCPIHQV